MQDHCNESLMLSAPAGPASNPQAYKDETGKTFGRLTVVGRKYMKNNKPNMRNRAIFTCRCSCGNEIDISGNLLRKGVFRECGACAQKWEAVK